MRSSVEFSYRLVGTGWSEGRFAIGKSWASQLDALVAAVAAGARAVIEEHGEDGYVAKWIEHRFPTQALLALEEWVSSR